MDCVRLTGALQDGWDAQVGANCENSIGGYNPDEWSGELCTGD